MSHSSCRVRKRFYVANVGNGPLELALDTKAPWCVVAEWAEGAEGAGGARPCGAGCACAERSAARGPRVPLYLEPRTSVEVTPPTIYSIQGSLHLKTSCTKMVSCRLTSTKPVSVLLLLICRFTFFCQEL